MLLISITYPGFNRDSQQPITHTLIPPRTYKISCNCTILSVKRLMYYRVCPTRPLNLTYNTIIGLCYTWSVYWLSPPPAFRDPPPLLCTPNYRTQSAHRPLSVFCYLFAISSVYRSHHSTNHHHPTHFAIMSSTSQQQLGAATTNSSSSVIAHSSSYDDDDDMASPSQSSPAAGSGTAAGTSSTKGAAASDNVTQV